MDITLDLGTQVIVVMPALQRFTMGTVVRLPSQNLQWKEAGEILALEGLILPTNRIAANPQGLRTDATNNIRAGIVDYGSGQQALIPIRAGIKSTFDCDIRGGIAADNLTAPVDAFAYHMGQGAVLFCWKPPVTGTPDYYEIYTSVSSAGPYTKQQMGEFRGLRGVLFNVPLGVSVYFQIRACRDTGYTGPFAQVKQGKIQDQTVTMSIRGIEGSIIKANAIFTMIDPDSGRLVAIRNPTQFEVTAP